MKFLSCFILMLVLASCNSNPQQEDTSSTTATADTTATPVKEEVKFLYPSSYPSDWEIGDPNKIVRVQELYKVLLADSNYESTLPYYADTVINVLFDNRRLKLSAKDFVDRVKTFRKGFKTLDEEFRNYVCLKSTAQNQEMVMIWVNEKGTRLDGKVDSSSYHETWRFNDQGKIDYRSSYIRYDF